MMPPDAAPAASAAPATSAASAASALLPPPLLQRWKVVCAYDGSTLCGWQSQPGGQTVQDFIEARLAQLFGAPVRIHGSGRTDAGVHARAQVFHFDGNWQHPPEALLRALRSGLPASVAVRSVRRAPPGFHARFSATGKRYVYHWFEGFALPWESPYCWSMGNRRLDIAAMNAAAAPLLGQHDFTAFGASRGDGSIDNPVKTLYELKVLRSGPRLRLVTEGSGYLYKMVRTLAGALTEVGLGKLPPQRLKAILDSRVRPMNLPTAPAKGLWLEHVYYGKLRRQGTARGQAQRS